jgi:hypothetical protein
MAYHAAKKYDVTRYQMYNEPDQSGSTITRGEWVDRLKVASDAVRTAIADVNRDFGKSLGADVSAPTTKGGASTIDTWGRDALVSNRTDYAGRAVNYDVFNTYDLHRYDDADTNGVAYRQDIQTLKTKIPQYNASGAMLPVTYTEFNRRSSSGFSGSPSENLNAPEIYTDFATIYLEAMSENVKGMYAFKFNQTTWEGTAGLEPQKTGFHYVDETAPTYDTTGSTVAGEVVRLFAKGFKGERPRLSNAVSASNANYRMATSFDAGSGNYYLYGVNRNTADTFDLTVDVSGWNVAPGTVVSVEEVGSRHMGEVVQLATVGADRKLRGLSQPAKSVWLMTVPSGPAQAQLNLSPVADAQVRNSAGRLATDSRNTNYGAQPTARVARSESDAAGDHATFLKFDLGAVDADDVSRAILWVTGQNVTTSNAETFHVYAITNDAWSENGITWANAPGLLPGDSKMAGVGTGAFPVGHLTFTGTRAEFGVDVTEFLQGHGDGVLSFALIREERFDGDFSGNVVELFTRESAFAPRLMLSVPEPGAATLLALAGIGALVRRGRR